MKSINIALGPSCYTKCRGCYNHFGNTAKRGNRISAAEILEFVRKAIPLGAQSVTLHGGDPLSHPEIIQIAAGIKQLGLRVKLDTVGTPFLQDANIVFFGGGVTPLIEMGHLLPFVDNLGIPVDGPNNAVGRLFRDGRERQVDEAFEIIDLALSHSDTAVNTNSVLHKGNLDHVVPMVDRIAAHGVQKLQIFQFQATGPIATRNQDRYSISHDAFRGGLEAARTIAGNYVDVNGKSAVDRDGAYFLIDDAAIAYVPNGAGQIRIGHISRDESRVLAMLDWHFNATGDKTIGQALREVSALSEGSALTLPTPGLVQNLPIFEI